MEIVGIGIVSCAGLNVAENWSTMLKGKTAIGRLRDIDTDGLGSPNGGQVPYSNEDLMGRLRNRPKSQARLPLERGEILLLLAFEEAVADAGYDMERFRDQRVALLVGTSLSGFTNMEREFRRFQSVNRDKMRPSAYLTYPLHICLDRLAYEYGLSGPRYLFSTACSASLHPIAVAHSLFARDEIDTAIIGGTDPLSVMSLAGFSSLKFLARDGCSPFSSTDVGISVGEGAGVLVLRREEPAKERPKSSYATVAGFAGTSDAYHPTASDPTGETIRTCIREAIGGFDLKSRTVFVMSHGTGTPHNDVVETRAIKQVEQLEGARVGALKSIIGHTLGASGAIELAVLAKSVSDGQLTPIANFTTGRPGCDLKYCTESAATGVNPVGVKNAFAFGGNNVVVVIDGSRSSPPTLAAPWNEESVVVTGIGVVSPFDIYDTSELYETLESGRTSLSSVDPVRGFNRTRTTSSVGLVDQERLTEQCAALRFKNTRKMDRISRMAAAAAAMAARDGGQKITPSNSREIGLVSATATGPLESVHGFYRQLLEKGVRRADANVFPNTVVNAHLGYVSIELKVKGYTTVISQGASSPYAALQTAHDLICSEQCGAVLVGAVCEYSVPFHRALIDIGWAFDGELQPSYMAEPNGNIIAEGAVFFLIERESRARERGAACYARLLDVIVGGEPGFPGTYQFSNNPLVPLLDRMKRRRGAPTYFAGDGNGLRQDHMSEVNAVRAVYHDTPITSASPYFGLSIGVTPFYNLALFCRAVATNSLLGLPAVYRSRVATNYAPMIFGTTDDMDVQSVVAGGVSAGGSAGAVWMERMAK